MATGLPAAASFKHVSPAGAAIATPLPDALRQAYRVGALELSPRATAYARARGADRVSSFGDWAALSDEVDASTARLLQREMSDGVVAPGFAPEALDILRRKHGGRYVVLQMDPGYEPPESEAREVFGLALRQRRNDARLDQRVLDRVVTRNAALSEDARRDLLVALVALKYTQSNSVALAFDGQTIGIGAGQQSRIHCTRLAAAKADTWWLRQHPRVLGLPFAEGLKRWDLDNAVDQYLLEDLSAAEEVEWRRAFRETPERLTRDEKRAWLDRLSGVSLGSDAFLPFRDNVDRASRSGVHAIAQPGGSLRDPDVIAACDEYGMAMAFTVMRLFHH